MSVDIAAVPEIPDLLAGARRTSAGFSLLTPSGRDCSVSGPHRRLPFARGGTLFRRGPQPR